MKLTITRIDGSDDVYEDVDECITTDGVLEWIRKGRVPTDIHQASLRIGTDAIGTHNYPAGTIIKIEVT